METMVLPESAGPVSGRHEKRRSLMIEVRGLDRLHHISSGEDAWITFLSRSELSSPVEGLLIRFGKDFGFHPACFKGRLYSKGAIIHIGDVDLFRPVGHQLLPLRRKGLCQLHILSAI